MAQTTYEEYLKQFGSAAAAQPTGMMQPTIAMPDVSAIENAVKNIKTVNDAYTIPERADLNKVREEFLAKKAQDSTAQLQSLINSRSTGGDGGNNADGSGGYLTGEMSDADFVSQMAYGIQNVQTLANMGLISQQTAQALINDAIAKAKAVDPQVLQTQDPAPVRDAITGAVTGKSGGTAYSGSFSGGWSDGGTGVGVGGGSVGAGGGNAAGGFSYGGW